MLETRIAKPDEARNCGLACRISSLASQTGAHSGRNSVMRVSNLLVRVCRYVDEKSGFPVIWSWILMNGTCQSAGIVIMLFTENQGIKHPQTFSKGQ